jgi:alpha-tubulin suppressor-like RCC1 family protein
MNALAFSANCWLYWGANEGRGETLGTNQETPELIDQDIIDLVAGPRYTLLVDVEGNAYASGFVESKFEYLGQFGVDSERLEEGPNQWELVDKVADLSGKEANAPAFAKVYAGASATANSGEMHSVFIDQNGNVYTSGNNNRGQLCLGDTDPRYIPHQVSLKEPAVAAAVGEDFTLILLEDGSVYGCGSNEKGELGLGNSVMSVTTPDNSNGLSNIIDLSAGLNHALFQAQNGNVLGTGSNIYMQLCEFTDGEPITTPKVGSCKRFCNLWNHGAH